MQQNKPSGLIVRIKIKDEQGRVVDEIDAVAFKGLLSLAHDEGLRSVRTKLIQVPTDENGKTAIAESTVRTRKGTFTGIGDASPSNVNRRIAPHIIRMAETRATARALRLAVNIGEVAIEELGENAERAGRSDAPRTEARTEPSGSREQGANDTPPSNGTGAPPERFRGRDSAPTEAADGDRRAMSEEQRKLLFRLAFTLGESRESSGDRVLKALGVERFEHATRVMASRAIDALKGEVAARGTNANGAHTNGNGASNGAGAGHG